MFRALIKEMLPYVLWVLCACGVVSYVYTFMLYFTLASLFPPLLEMRWCVGYRPEFVLFVLIFLLLYFLCVVVLIYVFADDEWPGVKTPHEYAIRATVFQSVVVWVCIIGVFPATSNFAWRVLLVGLGVLTGFFCGLAQVYVIEKMYKLLFLHRT